MRADFDMASGSDASVEYEVHPKGTADRIAQLEADLAACQRNAGAREAAFVTTSKVWDTSRTDLEARIHVLQLGVGDALRAITRVTGAAASDVRRILSAALRNSGGMG